MKKYVWLIWAAVLAAVMIGAYALYNSLGDRYRPDQLSTVGTTTQDTDETTQPQSQPDETVSPYAPDFTVYDLQGNAYQLSDFRGKPVVVNFWASWCGPCKSEMPAFESVYQTYGDRIHFLFVNLTDGYQETVEKASEFIRESGYTFPVYYDTDQFASIAYGVSSIPATYFIDAQGMGIAWASGALDEETILRGINMILP